MDNINKYNIVFAIVDSVRHYHTEGDDRTRLDFMDEFAEESIEFQHVITSAPSTVMSISAMMTSLPSFYLGRNYTDFRFDNNYFTTLSSILNNNGWETRALIMHPDIRDKLRVFDLIPKKYWPKGFSHKTWWDNKKINELLKNSLKIDGENTPKPCFWFLDFNCREDPDTSDIVKDSFAALKEAGYNEENTIFILCSDHGYPDPKRGITPELLKERNLTHDIFMTEDNIRIPFFMSYPGCSRGQKVKDIISTLDIKPTLLQLLNIEVDDNISSKWHGKGLLPLINQNDSEYDTNRLIRVDARFFGQPGRVSAMCGKNYKYVYQHDTGEEEFIDLSNYMIDEKNILGLASNDERIHSELNRFRNAFSESESQGSEFQMNYAIYKFRDKFDYLNKVKDKNPSITLISTAQSSFLESVCLAIKGIVKGVEVTAIAEARDLDKGLFQECYVINRENGFTIDNIVKIEATDLSIVIYDSSKLADFEKLKVLSQKIKSNKIIMMDLNMSLSINKGQASRYLKTLYLKKDFFFEEPSLIFFEIMKVLKALKRKLISLFKAR